MKIVSLDFWGTIAVYNPAYAKARTAFLAKLFGMDEVAAHERYKTVKHAFDYRAEHFGFAQSPLSCVKGLLEGTALTRDTNAVEVLDEIEAMVRENPPIITPEMIDLLDEAGTVRGHVLGIASNTNFIRGSLILELYPALRGLSFHVHSDEIGVSKPDPDFFRVVQKKALAMAGTIYPLWDMLHIGDNQKCDVAGATRARMMGLLTRSPEETISILREHLDIARAVSVTA